MNVIAITQIFGTTNRLARGSNNNKPNERNKMKTLKQNLMGTGMALAIALTAWLPYAANAADEMKPMKGGEHLLMLQGIKTQADVDALKTDDTIAMVCAKCKTVYVTRVKQGVKGA